MSKSKLFTRTILIGGLLASQPLLAAERHVDVDSFDELEVKGSPDVLLVQGSEEGVWLTGNEDDIDNMDVFVRGGRLVIKPKKQWGILSWFSSHGHVHAEVRFKTLNTIDSAGSNDLEAEGFRGESLDLSIDGSGDIEMAGVQLESLNVNVSGSADVELEGSTSSHAITINGSSDYSATELQSQRASIEINGSADVDLHAARELKVLVNGSGDVTYTGSPEVKQRINGVGDVRADESHSNSTKRNEAANSRQAF